MATTIIGTKGAELDLLVRQGATFGPYQITLTNPDLTPVDLTGATFRAQIRKSPLSVIDQGISAVFTYTNRIGGVFGFEFTAQDTASLTAGVDENAADSQYLWDLEMQDSTGRVLPLLYGAVKLFREVSNEA